MSHPVPAGTERLNRLSTAEFAAELTRCCAVPEWARRLAGRRPFADLAGLREVAAVELARLDWTQVLRALEAHPRIGQRAGGSGVEAAWSRAEQSAAATEDEAVQADLIAANVAYEARFGYVFLICANGLGHREILAAARGRLANEEPAEQAVVRAELAKIVDLRIRKLVDG